MDIRQKTKTKTTTTTKNKKPYRIHKIQSTEFKRFNKLKCPSKKASVSLGREKKAISSGERGKDLGGETVAGRGEPDLVLGEEKGLKP